jgi:hypothetical protein
VNGDKVQVLGGNMSGTIVPSRLFDNGSLELSISDEVKNSDTFAWVFKITFGGVDGTDRSGNASGSSGGPVATQTRSVASRVDIHVATALVVAGLLALLA